MSCDARQYGDEMKCGRCGLSWDTNDPDPPACGKKIDRRAIPDRRVTDKVRKIEKYASGGPVPETERLVGEAVEGRQYAQVRRHRSRSWLDRPAPPASTAAFRELVDAMPGAMEPYPPEWQANGRSAWIPEELPGDLADDMANAAIRACVDGDDWPAAMRAAYKVFLARVGPG